MKRFICLFLLSYTLLSGATAQQHPFKVYGFIVYAGFLENGQKHQADFTALQQYLESHGIGKYNLIYEHKVLDYPDGDKQNGVINLHRMDSLAALAAGEPSVLVSLDLEGWKRFDTVNTPRRMLDAIKAFRQTDKRSPLGFYATVPQDTYGYPKDTSVYNRLNHAYGKVADAVDYYSPSLYNYKGADSLEWYKEAVYNIKACRKYGHPDKQIIPYISPEIWTDGKTTFLTYEQMMYRLEVLEQLGANGCFLWTSSKTRNPDGRKIYLDADTGWLKAVIDFAGRHANRK